MNTAKRSVSGKVDLGLRAIAAHEAGHAVLASVLGVPFRSVSIIPTTRTLGRVVRHSRPTTAEEYEKEILVKLAGTIAERRHTGWDNWQGALGDYWGIAAKLAEARLSFTEAMQKAEALIAQHWPAICVVMNVLLVKQRLTRAQVLILLTTDKNRGRGTRNPHNVRGG